MLHFSHAVVISKFGIIAISTRIAPEGVGTPMRNLESFLATRCVELSQADRHQVTPSCRGRTFRLDWRAPPSDSGFGERQCLRPRVLAVGEVPQEVMKAIRLRRMTALSKPDGGVWAVIYSVGWSPAHLPSSSPRQCYRQILRSNSPSPPGHEAVTHALHAQTSLDENATMVSIDHERAFDLIFRIAMVSGLMAKEHGDRMWPSRLTCGRMIAGSPMTFPKAKAASKTVH